MEKKREPAEPYKGPRRRGGSTTITQKGQRHKHPFLKRARKKKK